MQVKALKCVVDVCIYFNEHGTGKESEEPRERKARAVRQTGHRGVTKRVVCRSGVWYVPCVCMYLKSDNFSERSLKETVP